MQVLVEKEYYIQETHLVSQDDYPVMGMSSEQVVRSVTHGPLKTEEDLEAKINEIINKYSEIKRVQIDKWTHVDIAAVQIQNRKIGRQIVLKRNENRRYIDGPEIDPRADTIRLAVKEVIVYEKRI